MVVGFTAEPCESSHKKKYPRLFCEYPLVNVYLTMERSTMFFNGKTHYFYGHFQVRKLLLC